MGARLIETLSPAVPRDQWVMAEPFGPQDWTLRAWSREAFRLEPITPRARVLIRDWAYCRDLLGAELVCKGFRCQVHTVHLCPGETLEIGVNVQCREHCSE